MDRKLLDKAAIETLRRRQELAERETEERQRAEADRLRAELIVLEAIARHGVYWPGDDR
jgi:hypothetical protein